MYVRNQLQQKNAGTPITSAIACRQLRLLDGDGSGEGCLVSAAARDSVASARGTGLLLSSGWLCSKDLSSSAGRGVRDSTRPSKSGSEAGSAAAGGLSTGTSTCSAFDCLASLFLRSSHEHTLKNSINALRAPTRSKRGSLKGASLKGQA